MISTGDPELTEELVRRSFDERSYERGVRYHREKRVVRAVRFHDALWGAVEGRRAEPYRVTVEPHEDGILSYCSCPVGSRCKHGVALALQWLEEPGSFVDGEAVIEDLAGRSGQDLADLVESMVRSDPYLIPSFERAILLYDATRGEAGREAIARAAMGALGRGLDYYGIEGAVEDLREVLGIAGHLADSGGHSRAADACLLVVETCLEAHRRGADDSSGTLGELVFDAGQRFNVHMEEVEDDAFREEALQRVLSLYDRDEYGLEVDQMFRGIVTVGNVGTVIEALEHRIGTEAGEGRYGHRSESIRELISDLEETVEKGG